MTPELKKLWADALRSGKYTQGYSNLKNSSNGRYCCMGVLAEICGATWVDSVEFKKIVGSTSVAGKSDQRLHPIRNGKPLCSSNGSAYLSEKFLAEIGLCFEQQKELVMKNDECVGFLDIAKLVDVLPENNQ